MGLSQNLLLEAARQVDEIPDGIADEDHLRLWWLDNSMSDLLEGVEREVLGIRKRAFDTLVYSSRKHSLVQQNTENQLPVFKARCTISELVKTLSLIIVGSVGRYEAEMTNSDVDLDIVFSCTDTAHTRDYIFQADTHLLTPLKTCLDTIKECELHMEHRVNYSYQRLTQRIRDGDYSHLCNLLLTGQAITNENIYNKEIQKIIAQLPWPTLQSGLLPELTLLLQKEVAALASEEQTFLKTRKLMYHIMTYLMQALALIFIQREPLKVARLNYWKICELLKRESEISHRKWRRLRKGVLTAMDMRNYDKTILADDEEEAIRHVARSYITARGLAAKRRVILGPKRLQI